MAHEAVTGHRRVSEMGPVQCHARSGSADPTGVVGRLSPDHGRRPTQMILISGIHADVKTASPPPARPCLRWSPAGRPPYS